MTTAPKTQVSIIDGPVPKATAAPDAAAGGLLVFEGFVR